MRRTKYNKTSAPITPDPMGRYGPPVRTTREGQLQPVGWDPAHPPSEVPSYIPPPYGIDGLVGSNIPRTAGQPVGNTLRPYWYPSEMNLPISKYYDPEFSDPLMKQYVRKPCQEIPVVATSMFRPELMTRGRGWSFQRLFDTDPCPQGWVSATSLPPQQQEQLKQYPESDIRGFCVRAEDEFEPVLYTDKSMFYGNSILMKEQYTDLKSARPTNEYKDYGYLTQRPVGYVDNNSGYSFVYSP
jgi:hypothetical protein